MIFVDRGLPAPTTRQRQEVEFLRQRIKCVALRQFGPFATSCGNSSLASTFWSGGVGFGRRADVLEPHLVRRLTARYRTQPFRPQPKLLTISSSTTGFPLDREVGFHLDMHALVLSAVVFLAFRPLSSL